MMMKFLTVLLIYSTAILCISDVGASGPVQVKNNNIGDINSIKIDINGKVHNVVDVNIINIVLTLLQETGSIEPTLSNHPDIPHLNELIQHINSRK